MEKEGTNVGNKNKLTVVAGTKTSTTNNGNRRWTVLLLDLKGKTCRIGVYDDYTIPASIRHCFWLGGDMLGVRTAVQCKGRTTRARVFLLVLLRANTARRRLTPGQKKTQVSFIWWLSLALECDVFGGLLLLSKGLTCCWVTQASPSRSANKADPVVSRCGL